MGKDICSGKSPWKCDQESIEASFELRRRGISLIGIDPVSVLHAILKREWDELMRDEEPLENDRMEE